MRWAAVEKMGLALPGVDAGTSWGSPALKIHGQMFACIPTHKSAEPDSIVVRLDFAQRDEMLGTEPDVYYIAEHYENYPCVLVRLKKVHPDALRDLIGMAWKYVDGKARKRRPPSRARRARR